jgi:arylsulfatase A-like enzyme
MDDGYADVGSFEHPCNGALRGYKGSLWEGGHRVPFIARWPGHIPAGSECRELVTLLDFTATFTALAGQPLPADAAPDSFNVLPALLGQPHAKPARDTFIAHVGGTKGPMAIRQGQWKLIQAGGARESYADANKTHTKNQAAKKPPGPWVVNLADDLSETKNLADAHPEKVTELRSLYEKLREAGRSRP